MMNHDDHDHDKSKKKMNVSVIVPPHSCHSGVKKQNVVIVVDPMINVPDAITIVLQKTAEKILFLSSLSSNNSNRGSRSSSSCDDDDIDIDIERYKIIEKEKQETNQQQQVNEISTDPTTTKNNRKEDIIKCTEIGRTKEWINNQQQQQLIYGGCTTVGQKDIIMSSPGYPPYRASIMDGYAIMYSTTTAPTIPPPTTTKIRNEQQKSNKKDHRNDCYTEKDDDVDDDDDEHTDPSSSSSLFSYTHRVVGKVYAGDQHNNNTNNNNNNNHAQRMEEHEQQQQQQQQQTTMSSLLPLAYYVTTGAMVPNECTHVVPMEEIQQISKDGLYITIPNKYFSTTITPITTTWIRPPGCDIPMGTKLFEKNHILQNSIEYALLLQSDCVRCLSKPHQTLQLLHQQQQQESIPSVKKIPFIQLPTPSISQQKQQEQDEQQQQQQVRKKNKRKKTIIVGVLSTGNELYNVTTTRTSDGFIICHNESENFQATQEQQQQQQQQQPILESPSGGMIPDVNRPILLSLLQVWKNMYKNNPSSQYYHKQQKQNTQHETSFTIPTKDEEKGMLNVSDMKNHTTDNNKEHDDNNDDISFMRILDFGIVRDDDAILHIQQTLQEMIQLCDIVITTGGISMGETDRIKQILLSMKSPPLSSSSSSSSSRNCDNTNTNQSTKEKFTETSSSSPPLPLPLPTTRSQLHFGRLNMKPGKPTTFITVPKKKQPRKDGTTVNNDDGDDDDNDTCLVFAMPGNPCSGIVCTTLLVRPCLDLLFHQYYNNHNNHNHTRTRNENEKNDIDIDDIDRNNTKIRTTTTVQEMIRHASVHAEIDVMLAHDIPLDHERPEYHRVTIQYPSSLSSSIPPPPPSFQSIKDKFMNEQQQQQEQQQEPKYDDSVSSIPIVTSTGIQRSSRLLSMFQADGYVILPRGTIEKSIAKAGEIYTFLSIPELRAPVHKIVSSRTPNDVHQHEQQQQQPQPVVDQQGMKVSFSKHLSSSTVLSSLLFNNNKNTTTTTNSSSHKNSPTTMIAKSTTTTNDTCHTTPPIVQSSITPSTLRMGMIRLLQNDDHHPSYNQMNHMGTKGLDNKKMIANVIYNSLYSQPIENHHTSGGVTAVNSSSVPTKVLEIVFDTVYSGQPQGFNLMDIVRKNDQISFKMDDTTIENQSSLLLMDVLVIVCPFMEETTLQSSRSSSSTRRKNVATTTGVNTNLNNNNNNNDDDDNDTNNRNDQIIIKTKSRFRYHVEMANVIRTQLHKTADNMSHVVRTNWMRSTGSVSITTVDQTSGISTTSCTTKMNNTTFRSTTCTYALFDPVIGTLNYLVPIQRMKSSLHDDGCCHENVEFNEGKRDQNQAECLVLFLPDNEEAIQVAIHSIRKLLIHVLSTLRRQRQPQQQQ